MITRIPKTAEIAPNFITIGFPIQWLSSVYKTWLHPTCLPDLQIMQAKSIRIRMMRKGVIMIQFVKRLDGWYQVSSL